MSPERNKQLIQKLTAYDLDGTKYYEAKQALLKEGYMADEIDLAAASAPFDGRDNNPKTQDDSGPYGAASAADVATVATELLEQDAEHRQRQLQLESASNAVLGSGISPMSIQSDIRLADQLGVPLFKLMGIGVFITAALYGVMINTSYVSLENILVFLKVYGLSVALYIYYKMLRADIFYFRHHTSKDATWIRSVLLAVVKSAAATALFLYVVFHAYWQ